MVQPKRDEAIRKVYQRQGELVIEGPFRRIQDNELVLTGRVAVKNPDGSPWGLVAVTLDMNPASPKYALQNVNFAALQGQKYRYHLYKIENGAKLTIAASDQGAMAMAGGMKYDIELPNASCIIEVDKDGGWIGDNIIFLNTGIAFFVWLLSIFAVKKWLENKEVHREIADREEMLRQIADNINGGVMTLVNDAGFCIRYANDGFLKLIGYTREELENVPSFLRAHLIYEEDTPKFQALLDGVWHLQDKIDLEMRLLHKNGRYVPVLIRGSVGTDKNGVLVMYCVIVDISEQKRIIQELALEKERYDLLVQASNEIIFDVEVLSGQIVWSPLYRKVFGLEPFMHLTGQNTAQPALSAAVENSVVISAFIRKILECQHSDSAELLLDYADGEQHWFRARANCIIKKGIVVRLVGKLENIDAEVLEKVKLQDMSRIDQLTGVFNKSGFKTVVEPLLREGSFGSLIFVDLDNFKTLNDTLGHQTGDKALQEMAAKLQQFFRLGDVIGRFGGDEFYVYAPGLSPEAIVKRAEELSRVLSAVYGSVKVSASIGICYFPEHGQDFEKLVHLADMAAYVVKNNGKGGYHIYEPGDKI
ncbi:sensor domain-containing diguanylate cyclase [Phascolarctobacterium sp.]